PEPFDVLVLRKILRTAAMRCPGCLVGVDRIGLALHPPHRCLGTDDFPHDDAAATGGDSQPGAVRAGAFNPDDLWITERVEEIEGLPVTNRRCRELRVVQITTETIDRGDVDGIGVSINSAEDRPW